MSKRDLRLLAEKKREGEELSAEEWASVVEHAVAHDGDPAQIAALFMACYFRGLSVAETIALTRAMVESGDVLHFRAFTGAVDKHSSGGVGDTASLVLVPLLAECGEHVAKLSGRALGHTGGTLDKLESIPGMRVEIDPDEFEAIIARVGCSIAAQSSRLVPADKVLYSLRDRTGTVPSIGLIASSIVSKKIAGGAERMIFDVKMGGGAFMKTVEQARALAQLLVSVAEGFGKEAVALVTDMSQPLAPAVGNGIEVALARDFLSGKTRPRRLTELVRNVACTLLEMRLGKAAESLFDGVLQSGAALQRFESMIAAQGGDVEAFRALGPVDTGTPIIATASGFLSSVRSEQIGNAARHAMRRGGPNAGIGIAVELGDHVERGAEVGRVFGDPAAADGLAGAFVVSSEQVPQPPVIYERVTGANPEAENPRSSQ